jgi:SAM-dependent methyltransferase
VIPFLWVLPLSLYLLTFIICFDQPNWYWRGVFTLAAIPALAGVCLVLFLGNDLPLLVQISAYLAAMFLCCSVCHGELYRLKPHPRHLTSFYLMIAGGGAVGGVLVAIVAPLAFNSYLELHWGLAMFGLLLTLVYGLDKTALKMGRARVEIWRVSLVGVVALVLTLFVQVRVAARGIVSFSRNFYGVLRVFEHERKVPQGHSFFLMLGEITHGMQFVDPQRARWPTTYFHESSGVGLALRNRPREGPRRIGVIGLGVGTLAAYGRDGDYFRFYEINPIVVQLATTRFTYLSNCNARADIILGDARLSLENEPGQQFDLLAMDAFSNDAIPVHLLTREAFEIYRRHLKPDGVIAVNITNRHLDILPVVKNLAAQFGLSLARIAYRQEEDTEKGQWWHYNSIWVLLTLDREFLNQEAIRKAASEPDKLQPTVPLWTDDYASLFKILK